MFIKKCWIILSVLQSNHLELIACIKHLRFVTHKLIPSEEYKLAHNSMGSRTKIQCPHCAQSLRRKNLKGHLNVCKNFNENVTPFSMSIRRRRITESSSSTCSTQPDNNTFSSDIKTDNKSSSFNSSQFVDNVNPNQRKILQRADYCSSTEMESLVDDLPEPMRRCNNCSTVVLQWFYSGPLLGSTVVLRWFYSGPIQWFYSGSTR